LEAVGNLSNLRQRVHRASVHGSGAGTAVGGDYGIATSLVEAILVE
jgi:hypothetical protein